LAALRGWWAVLVACCASCHKPPPHPSGTSECLRAAPQWASLSLSPALTLLCVSVSVSSKPSHRLRWRRSTPRSSLAASRRSTDRPSGPPGVGHPGGAGRRGRATTTHTTGRLAGGRGGAVTGCAGCPEAPPAAAAAFSAASFFFFKLRSNHRRTCAPSRLMDCKRRVRHHPRQSSRESSRHGGTDVRPERFPHTSQHTDGHQHIRRVHTAAGVPRAQTCPFGHGVWCSSAAQDYRDPQPHGVEKASPSPWFLGLRRWGIW